MNETYSYIRSFAPNDRIKAWESSHEDFLYLFQNFSYHLSGHTTSRQNSFNVIKGGTLSKLFVTSHRNPLRVLFASHNRLSTYYIMLPETFHTSSFVRCFFFLFFYVSEYWDGPAISESSCVSCYETGPREWTPMALSYKTFDPRTAT